MTPFSVATWNIENLFRPGGSSGPKTQEIYEKKLGLLAGTISHIDADVIAVQEVGSVEAFADLQTQLPAAYAHSALSARPDGRGIRVGYFSKLALEAETEITTFPERGLRSVPGAGAGGAVTSVTRMGRGALPVTVRPTPNFAVTLITAHLKSKLLSFPGSRFSPADEDERARVAGVALLKRTAEAVGIRVRANNFNGRKALIVLGDLNDNQDAATTQVLHGKEGSQPDSKRAFNAPDKGDETRLFNLASLIPARRRYSRIHAGKKELLDHILASVEFFPGRPRRLPEVDSVVDFDGKLASIEANPGARRKEPASDHSPVVARFSLG